MTTYRDWAQESIQSLPGTHWQLWVPKKNALVAAGLLTQKQASIFIERFVIPALTKEEGKTPPMLSQAWEDISASLLPSTKPVSDHSRARKKSGFKAQMGAVTLHRKESKIHESCRKQEEKWSYALDAPGILSVTG